ncbi:NUDIX domain-containing protein [Nocardiopsis sediminis]|uniref:8-oxo-dGTP diphosphatase n=1 Tax=Nocardiopsis sediminis TaxID=1778267 RepID=A0ABV8FU22_9ACTN
MSPSPATPAPVVDALAWVRLSGRRLLCVRTREHELFYLPGGKREPGESDAEAVTREAAEEVGVVLRPATITPYAVIDEAAHGYPEGTRVRLACFTAEHDGEPAARNEVAELAWFGSADRARCAPAVRRLLDLLRADGLID